MTPPLPNRLKLMLIYHKICNEATDRTLKKCKICCGTCGFRPGASGQPRVIKRRQAIVPVTLRKGIRLGAWAAGESAAHARLNRGPFELVCAAKRLSALPRSHLAPHVWQLHPGPSRHLARLVCPAACPPARLLRLTHRGGAQQRGAVDPVQLVQQLDLERAGAVVAR